MIKSKTKRTVDDLLVEALVPEEEQPYEVPENWVFVKMLAIAEGQHGYAFKSNEYSETGIPIIRMGNVVGSNEVILNKEKLVYVYEERLDEFKKFIIKQGDILMSLTDLAEKGEFLGTVACYTQEKVALLNQRLLKIVYNCDKLHQRFMYYSLKSPFFRKYATQPAGGSIQKNISANFVLDYDFPLPPLNEQRRIADKVERLLNKIEESKQLIEEAKETFELRGAAILEKAFRGDLTSSWRKINPNVEEAELLYEKIQARQLTKKKQNKEIDIHEIRYPIPHSWKWVRIGDILKITSGGTPKRTVPEYYNGNIPWIKTGEIKWNLIESSKEHISSEALTNSSAKLLPKNTVLVAMYGQGLTRGRAAILNIEASCNQAVCAILPNEFILPEFLYFYFLEGYRRFRQLAKGGNQENLSASVIADFLFPMPPIKEQKAIVEIIKSIYKKENLVLDYIELENTINETKQSILSKAFRGQLGTNDPTEESAIELLKEVLQEQLK